MSINVFFFYYEDCKCKFLLLVYLYNFYFLYFRHGLRNSLLLAPMPTASTAQILGNNESIEPYTSNVYTRRVLSGEFQVNMIFFFYLSTFNFITFSILY